MNANLEKHILEKDYQAALDFLAEEIQTHGNTQFRANLRIKILHLAGTGNLILQEIESMCKSDIEIDVAIVVPILLENEKYELAARLIEETKQEVPRLTRDSWEGLISIHIGNYANAKWHVEILSELISETSSIDFLWKQAFHNYEKLLVEITKKEGNELQFWQKVLGSENIAFQEEKFSNQNQLAIANGILKFSTKEIDRDTFLQLIGQTSSATAEFLKASQGSRIELSSGNTMENFESVEPIMSFWGLHPRNLLAFEDYVPKEAIITQLEGFLPPDVPFWNITIQSLHFNLGSYLWHIPMEWAMRLPYPNLQVLKIHDGFLKFTVLNLLIHNWPHKLKHLEIRGMDLNYGNAVDAISFLFCKLSFLHISGAYFEQPLKEIPSFLNQVFQNISFSEIEELSIVNLGLSKRDLDVFTKPNFPNLKILDLSDNDLGPLPTNWKPKSDSLWYQLEEVSISSTGIEKEVVTWFLDHALETKVKRIFAEPEDRNIDFESFVKNHPNYAKFESIELYW